MRRITTLALLACLGVGCESDTTVGTDMIAMPATASHKVTQEASRPVLQFKDTLLDFGSVSEGHVVRHTFEFVNDGPGQALLADVSTTCGCTVAQTWPRDPLAPGTRGQIDVTFDTHDKSGPQDKVVSVVGNTDPGVVRLHLVGEVVSPTNP
jgi:hypothetical protein